MNNRYFIPILEKELDAVIALLKDAYAEFAFMIADDIHEIFKDSIRNGVIYGLWVDEVLVGTAVYGAVYGIPCGTTAEWEGQGLIRYMAVDKKYRRQGHGTYMVDCMLNDLKKRAKEYIGICVDADNIAAIGLWTKFGFEYHNSFDAVDMGEFHSYILYLDE